MDLNKTGLFISFLRKRKELTQKELADKIGTTDKAVSCWETGKGFPDVSLLIPLSEVLGVSVSDIIMGEKTGIEGKKTIEMTDSALISTSEEYSRREKNRIPNSIFLCGNVLPIYISVLLYLFTTHNNNGFWIYFWMIYDAAIVPAYLSAFNFLLNRGEFYAWKILVALSAELACVVIHMAQIQFSLVIWVITLGSAIPIIGVSWLVQYTVSKKWRKRTVKNEEGQTPRSSGDKPKIKAASWVIYSVISLAAPSVLLYTRYLSVYLIAEILSSGLLEYFTLHIIIYYSLVRAAAVILIILEIAAAVQIYNEGGSDVPLVGKLAAMVLRAPSPGRED